jgi:DNA-binding transcriptional LysR family regulator
MDLKQLQVLRAIAEMGSFKAAGDRLHLTQPAVTHQLKKLEAELNETLVRRGRPKATLLPAGNAVLSAADRIFAEIEALKQQFAPIETAGVRGQLRVAASTIGIVYFLGDWLAEFISLHPRIELILTATETPIDGARQVQSCQAVVAFTTLPVNIASLEELELGESEHVLIVSHQHPLARAKNLTVEELKEYSFIRYQAGAGSRTFSDMLFMSHGGYPDIFLESNDTEFIKHIVGLGLGVAIVPIVTVSRRHDKRVRVIELKDTLPLVQKFGLVYRRDIRMRVLQIFCDFCLQKRATLLPIRAQRTASGAA